MFTLHFYNIFIYTWLVDVIKMPREEIRDYFINKQILTIDTFQSTQVDLIPEIKAQDIRMHDSVISRFLVNCAHLFQKEHPSKVRNL